MWVGVLAGLAAAVHARHVRPRLRHARRSRSASPPPRRVVLPRRLARRGAQGPRQRRVGAGEDRRARPRRQHPHPRRRLDRVLPGAVPRASSPSAPTCRPSSPCCWVVGHGQRHQPHRRPRRPGRRHHRHRLRRPSSSTALAPRGRRRARPRQRRPAARRDHPRRLPRVPALERPPGPDLHGRLRRAAARPADGGVDDVGRAARPTPQYSGQSFFFLAPLFIPLVILGVPILDTVFAIVRRATRRSGVATADKEHLHHRLLSSATASGGPCSSCGPGRRCSRARCSSPPSPTGATSLVPARHRRPRAWPCSRCSTPRSAPPARTP